MSPPMSGYYVNWNIYSYTVFLFVYSHSQCKHCQNWAWELSLKSWKETNKELMKMPSDCLIGLVNPPEQGTMEYAVEEADQVFHIIDMYYVYRVSIVGERKLLHILGKCLKTLPEMHQMLRYYIYNIFELTSHKMFSITENIFTKLHLSSISLWTFAWRQLRSSYIATQIYKENRFTKIVSIYAHINNFHLL